MSLRRPADFAALLFAGALLAAHAAAQTPGPRQELTVDGKSGRHEFEVEIADDDRERAMGLMFRRSMRDDEGMLFDFGGEEPASFWMHNTYISLDMLFIRADGTVESIAERATPLSDKSISSKRPVRYVLEIKGGVSASLGLMPGDKVSGPAMSAH
jgi:uncharacterized membrane protein (UPF0127 family)